MDEHDARALCLHMVDVYAALQALQCVVVGEDLTALLLQAGVMQVLAEQLAQQSLVQLDVGPCAGVRARDTGIAPCTAAA